MPHHTQPHGPAPRWADVEHDVVVIGGGNAAIVSAIAAEERGLRVLVLERAPRRMRGGNTRHTRNIRCVHAADDYNSGEYSYDELWRDLCSVGEGPSNEEIASLTVQESESMPSWMYSHGARWQQPLAGTLHLGRTNRFFLGGGKALLNSYYRYAATRAGIEVSYDTKVEDLVFDGDRCTAVVAEHAGRRVEIRARAVICACGGFEANLDWLRQYWGDAVDNYIIRGTPFNDGHILARLFDAGAARAGQERGFHAIALDARAPRFDGGIATRLDTVPFGVTLNMHGQRFYDEGEEIWPKRYAIWGQLIAKQPGQIAYAIWDQKVNHQFLPPLYGVTTGHSVADVAAQLGLDGPTAQATVDTYNAAVVAGTFNPTILDDCRTVGLSPAKSHWAQRVDTTPYYGIAMRPGITFTYMGVEVGTDSRVRREDGTAFENVFAAGEIMSGNILSTGYLAGFGMTIGSVWGRRAGNEVATYAGR
ncbi:FAD-dependent tricarballylate dehydrogenase TcuA [Jatrophihabitans sp. DSM 45814]